MSEELVFSHPIDTTYTAPAKVGGTDADGTGSDADDRPVPHPVFSDRER